MGTSSYQHVLANLPTLPDLLDLQRRSEMLDGHPDPVPRPSSRLAGLFGSREKGKKLFRGLSRSRSASGQNDAGESSSGSREGHTRAHTATAIVIPPTGGPSTSTINIPQPHGRPCGFVNHSHDRVVYKNKMYPLHFPEAIKFTHQLALQERMWMCKDVNDMYPLSASFPEHVRSDWAQVFLKTVRGALSFYYACCFWVGVSDETGSELRWRKCCISSLTDIRAYEHCSYVQASRTLSMRTTMRAGVLVHWARVPANSVKRSFASGNDYGKKAKTKTVSACDAHVTCTPTHTCCILAFKHMYATLSYPFVFA